MPTSLQGDKYAAISVTGVGTHDLVAAVTGKKIVIKKLFLTLEGDVTVTLRDSGGTAITGAMTLGDNGYLNWPADGEEWGHTTAGTALQAVLSAAATLAGILIYREES